MSDAEDKEPEEIPEGMVRKTRRVRKKRKEKKTAQESKDHADTLFAKAKDLLIGMDEENQDHGHVNLPEQIRRLKKRKDDDRPLDDVWGTKKRSSSWLWIVLVGLIVSVVAIIIGVTKWLSDDPRSQGAGVSITMGQFDNSDLGKGPLAWFNENSVGVLDEIQDIITRVNKAQGPEDISDFVRDSPYRNSDELRPELWGDDCLTNPTSNFTWVPKVVNASEGAGEKKRGFLQVAGSRSDGNPFEAYFVKVGDRVLLDWDATVGWSEMSVAEIARTKPRKDMLLRCRVTKKTGSDQEFSGTRYSGYVLSSEIIDEFFLAYVSLNSEQGKIFDRDLKLLLNYGSFVTDKPPLKDQKVTIRVRFNSDVGREGEFEIVEFLHDGWVSP